MAKQVKLADIAEKLNVSTVTVSKALTDQKGVSEELRVQIKTLAVELGYVSPSVIKMNAEKNSFNIGVIVSERYFEKTQSFYWLMYQELTTKANSTNCFTVLEIIKEDDEQNNIVPKLLAKDDINGLIIIGIMKKEYLEAISDNSRVPVVYLDFYSKDKRCDAVVTNNYMGMYQLTDYLCELGHKKIAYVGTLFSTDSITDRYFGYCKALYEHGIEVRKDYIIEDRRLDSGIVNKNDIKLPDDMPTAFACNCDQVAADIISILEEKGYNVPEDISVIGFDNYAYGNDKSVEITTYEVNVKEMVLRCLNILMEKIHGDVKPKGVIVVEGQMIIKESVKALR